LKTNSKGDVSSVIIEGIQGGRFRPRYHSIFSGFRKICAAYDVVLILDEVQSGYGRSGKFLHTNIMISKQI
jgi:acetylornithine aminotransferase